jgi:methylmalonyl-CoA/ethylmalonyl-CoA epimerase
MVIDHIGIAVRSIEQSTALWTKVLGYRRITEVVSNTRQKVNVLFLAKSGSATIKLIEPSGPDSPLIPFLRKGGGLHHLCFKCRDMDSEMERLKRMGLRCIGEPQPGEAFENERIAFFFAGNGLNMELIETDKRAARIDDVEEV